MSQKGVVIIGAGAMGCSIAYHLARQGVPSEIIERDGIAARASGKAWAVYVYPPLFRLYETRPPDILFSMPEGGVRPWQELYWLGYHRLPDIALDLREKGEIDIEYGELSWLKPALSDNEEKGYKTDLTLLRSEGYYEASWLLADDVREIFPEINLHVRGAIIFPCLQIEPYRYTLGLAQAAEKMGASIRQGEAVGFRHQGSRITSVTLATGTEVETEVVVLAMGPWNRQGTSWLGKELPIRINREQCLRVQVPQRLPPCGLSVPGVAIIPKVNGEVILGASGIPDMQNSFDVSLTTEEVKNEILDAAINLLPTLKEAKLIEHRGDFEGWAPAPNNIQPVLGRLPDWDNAYIAARMGTQGMMMSVGGGLLMAELIAAGGRMPNRYKTMMEVLSPCRL